MQAKLSKWNNLLLPTTDYIVISKSKCCYIGPFQKNPNMGGSGYTFLETPWNFSFFYFIPGNSRQNKAQPMDIPQNCVRFLGNSKAKNKNPWKFHIIFSWSLHL